MLKELYIGNVAIIKESDISFDRGFTVLTGETGAGKSIIIDSIGFITGARASRENIRSGEDKAFVSALFEDIPEDLRASLGELGIASEDGTILISREINASGSSSAKINGRPFPVTVIRDIADRLINIHGQHASQSLLDETKHIYYLDAFSGNSDELAEFSVLYSRSLKLNSDISSLRRDEREKARLTELYKYQISDIDSMTLKPGEEEELKKKRNLLKNAEKLSKYSKLIFRALYRNEKGYSANDLIDKASQAISELSDTVPEADEYISALTDIKYRLEDIAQSVASVCDTDFDNPSAMLDKIETRLDGIEKLKRKYGDSTDEILAYREKAASMLDELGEADEKLSSLSAELEKTTSEMKSLSSVITGKRERAARILEKRITDELVFLDMNKVSFKIEISPLDRFSSLGGDGVRFLVSANAGEPLAPLSKIASGGELSRTMLALKCAFTDKERTPTLIFDEIDTGISGKTSHKIGLKLRLCARDCQVICVTHSPQIAALADSHLLISKGEENGRTFTQVASLSRPERINEIARIIGGAKITEKTLQAASDMLSQNDGIK